MNRFFAAALIFFICLTTIICVFRPKTHKHIMFENRNFKLELISQKAEADKQEINIDISLNTNLPQIELPKLDIKMPQKENTVSENKNNSASVNSNTSQKTAKTTNGVDQNTKGVNQKNSNKTQTVQNKSNDINVKSQQVEKKADSSLKNEPKSLKEEIKNDIKEETPPIPPVTKQKEKTEEQKEQTLSEQELEIIAWNKWRSDLQNKLMRDSKIAAPIGTTFYFSFTVDKFGNITNLKTWSNNSSYTPLAVKVIKPLLLSYQHTSILTFPVNSKRIITNAEGSFTMAHSSRYSSPSDYNDYERILK